MPGHGIYANKEEFEDKMGVMGSERVEE